VTILTIDEACEFLRVTRSQLYGMTRKRGAARMERPMPVIRLNGNLRFSKESLEEWLKELEEAS
jgi:excisionase family DNA binding protein